MWRKFAKILTCGVTLLAVAGFRPSVSAVSASDWRYIYEGGYKPDSRVISGDAKIKWHSAILAAIPSSGLSSALQVRERIEGDGSRVLCYNHDEPFTISISGQSNVTAFLNSAYIYEYEWFVGNNNENGFFLNCVTIRLNFSEYENNSESQYAALFNCVFKSQTGSRSDILTDVEFTPVSDTSLLPVVFTLSATQCRFFWKQAGKNFAYGDQLYTTSVSNFPTSIKPAAYQLKENQWPGLFAHFVGVAPGLGTAGFSDLSVQVFHGSDRVLPRMWYSTSECDIAWPANSTVLYGGYQFIDTDGGGQYDLSEYFYKRDPKDPVDDDPNYTQADPDIINIAVNDGYISIDNQVTELPSTGDVNIEVDPETKVNSVKSLISSKLSGGAFGQINSLLTGVPDATETDTLPSWRIPNECWGIFGDGAQTVMIDFNVFRDNEEIWRLFRIVRLVAAACFMIYTALRIVAMIMEAMKA